MNRFTTLLVSQWVANAGDALYIVALIATLYQQTGQASTAALFPIAVTAGMTMSGFFFASLARRFRHASLLLFSQLIKTITLGLIVFLDLPLASLLVCVVWIAFLDGFARPIESAFLPRITDDLQKANSLVQGTNQVVQLVMWPLGAIFVSVGSPHLVLMISFGLFIGATLWTTLFHHQVRHLADPVEDSDESPTFQSSFRYTRTHPAARLNTALLGIDAFASTAWISALFLVYIDTHLALSGSWWGILNAFYLLSMIGGSYCMLRRTKRTPLLMSSVLLSIGATVLFASAPHVVFAIVACIVQGAASQLRAIDMNTRLQEATPIARLPYVYSMQQTVYTLSFCLGSLLFGLLADRLNIEIVYWIAAVIALLMLPSARRLQQSVPASAERHVS
ncbi:MFS transporter [Exiguobacterium sp. s192]|uniref:MFS transporter n=1 Tax=Exiguobacterium sp. s192 TaxID=2751206 RepID=UPI001BE7D01B|nr:MFS transporter [Exiguobacterium sp. s192]